MLKNNHKFAGDSRGKDPDSAQRELFLNRHHGDLTENRQQKSSEHWREGND